MDKISLNRALITIDQIYDYIPVVSTVTNFVDIFEKCVFKGLKQETIDKNRYFSHIKDKSNLRCVVLLVPFIGNIIIGIYDLIQNKREREHQDLDARILGLDVRQLPHSVAKRREVIENKRQENFKEAILKASEALDKLIVGLQASIEKFKKLVNNPEEPLEVQGFFGVIRGEYKGTQQEKIAYFWSSYKMAHALQGLGNVFMSLADIDKNEMISKKKLEISQLTQELLQIRQAYYRDFIKDLSQEDLLKEAQKYYLDSYFVEEQKKPKETINNSDLKTLLPKLKERILDEKVDLMKKPELREIIARIENLQ